MRVRAPAFFYSIAKTDADLFGGFYCLVLCGNHLKLAGAFCQRDTFDLSVYDTDHDAVFLIHDGFGSACAQACRKDAVIRTGLAAALGVAGNGDADFAAGLFQDAVCDLIRYRRILFGSGSLQTSEKPLVFGNGC